jgi:homoserine kinase type II
LRDERLKRLGAELDKVDLPDSLPQGIIHADCHYTNFLFIDNKLSGVLDFDDACFAPLIVDIANAIYFWAWPPGWPLDFDNAGRMIAAYHNVRPLSGLERRHLFDALKITVLMSIAWFMEDNEDVESEFSRISELEEMGRDDFLDKLPEHPQPW